MVPAGTTGYRMLRAGHLGGEAPCGGHREQSCRHPWGTCGASGGARQGGLITVPAPASHILKQRGGVRSWFEECHLGTGRRQGQQVLAGVQVGGEAVLSSDVLLPADLCPPHPRLRRV